MQRVLIRFEHGLGDNVQLGCVVRHLQVYRPDWEVHVLTQPGKESLFRGRCLAVARAEDLRPPYEHTFDLGWYENYNAYPDCPNTKVTNCLREVFGVEPDPALLHYDIRPSPDDLRAAADYYCGLGLRPDAGGRFPVVVAHHKGNTSPEKKNLSDADLLPLAAGVGEHGLTLVVLDWDDRTGDDLRGRPHVTVCSHLSAPALWKGMGSGDGGRIAALMQLARAWVGIDSGPGHVGGGTPTPGVVVWVRHHPVMFYDLCPNVTHLVPGYLDRLPPADRPGVSEYFRAHYNHYPYAHLSRDLAAHALAAAGVAPCPTNPMSRSHMLKATNFHVEYYEEHRAAGLDYLGHGEWQEVYGRWLTDALELRGEHVLDVGCACGSIAQGMRDAGALAHGVDLNNHMIRLGRERFPAVPLYVCDAVNLHLFGADSFRLVHSNQVAEHWRPDLVPFILREFGRVLKPGGVAFTVMDTLDLFERQGRSADAEDPTNACVRPLVWWREQFAAAGFAEAPDLADRLVAHPDSYFRRYDWDWLVFRKP